MKVPNELCSGSCGGVAKNCPYPFVCGISSADVEAENKMLRHLVGALVCIGLVVFCAGIIAWL
jgi:hypothetical protein